jgi:predicted lipoprotein with Yx(FWY)xxD motif
MNRLLIAGAVVAAAVVAAVGVVALLSGGGESDGSSAPAPAASSAARAPVSAEEIGNFGTVLVDRDGKALYASDEEANGMVLCTEACTSFWTPLTFTGRAPTDSSLPGTLGVVDRPGGGRQLTYDGRLLYSFVEDGPGEVSGDGFADAFSGQQQLTWHVVHSDSADNSSGSRGGPLGY